MSGSPKEAWAELQRDGAACSRSLKRQTVGRGLPSPRILLSLLLAREDLLNRALSLLRLEKIPKAILGPGERMQD